MSYKKHIFKLLFASLILFLVIYKLDTITNIVANLIKPTPNVVIDDANDYVYGRNHNFVKKSKDFIPYSKQDLYDIFYSLLDNGYDTFSFYCPSEYTKCLDDVKEISSNQIVLTHIGNFIHPYNNFTSLEVMTNSLGEIDVIVTKMYDEEMINFINTKLDIIFKEILTDDMDVHDQILAIHDYIIDNTYYDESNNDNSGNAYGLFKNGAAKCAGYADAMAIVLDRLDVVNYKVASEAHVWNAVYLDNTWSHLDLTWDDPVINGTAGNKISDTLRHKFYMIDTNTLMSYDTEEHNFDDYVYYEMR